MSTWGAYVSQFQPTSFLDPHNFGAVSPLGESATLLPVFPQCAKSPVATPRHFNHINSLIKYGEMLNSPHRKGGKVLRTENQKCRAIVLRLYYSRRAVKPHVDDDARA